MCHFRCSVDMPLATRVSVLKRSGLHFPMNDGRRSSIFLQTSLALRGLSGGQTGRHALWSFLCSSTHGRPEMTSTTDERLLESWTGRPIPLGAPANLCGSGAGAMCYPSWEPVQPISTNHQWLETLGVRHDTIEDQISGVPESFPTPHQGHKCTTR